MPETPPATAPEPAPVWVADRLRDFSDRLSPMLVKELRQGLRAKSFVAVFLILQGILALLMLTFIAATRDPGDAGVAVSRIVFLFYGLALIVIQPMRGIGALHREIDANTLELMVLTRLSAWRIVLGKWVSIVAQSALLFAAVLPYLVLRYWFGEMNLFGELHLLAFILLVSAALTATVIGISAIPSVLIRGLLPLLGLASGIIFIPAFVFDRDFLELIEIFALQDSEGRWVVFSLVAGFTYFSWLALGIGASMIAPAAENHSTVRRIVTLALLFVFLGIRAAIPALSAGATFTILFFLIAPVAFLALAEPFALLPPHCAPFVRNRALGRLAGRFLYPGWPSAVLWLLPVLGLTAATVAVTYNHYSRYPGSHTTSYVVLLSFLMALIFPATLLSFFRNDAPKRFTRCILILLTNIILVMVLVVLAEAVSRGERGFLWAFSWLPGVGLVMMESGGQYRDSTLWVVLSIFTSLYLGIVVVAALLQLGKVRAIEHQCRPHP